MEIVTGEIFLDCFGGGGGGGGASRLSDLLDVSISAASSGAILQLQDSGQWTDIYSLDGGTF